MVATSQRTWQPDGPAGPADQHYFRCTDIVARRGGRWVVIGNYPGPLLTAPVRWREFWAVRTGDGPGPPPPAATMRPLPNGNLDPITGTRVVPVAEIQSTNGG